jgi:hypothetical protein
MASVGDLAVSPASQTPRTHSDHLHHLDDPPPGVDRANSLVFQCPETESNRQHGDFQSEDEPYPLPRNRKTKRTAGKSLVAPVCQRPKKGGLIKPVYPRTRPLDP